MTSIQGRELNFGDFTMNTFNIVLLFDACVLIFFDIGKMKDTAKVYSVILI